MQFRHHRLENGLDIVAECNPFAHAASIGFFVNTGSRDERPEMAGVSHFLEHMVFKGTEKRSAADVNRQLDEMGSHSNARTGEERTIYHATVLPEFQNETVELFADILRPALRDSDFESERKVIIEEIKMYDDQPPFGGHETIMEKYFGDHPLSRRILGTSETVGAMSPESMREYFQSQYSPTNIVLAAAGDVNFESLVQQAERCCGGWQRFDTTRKSETFIPQKGKHVLAKPDAFQEYVLRISPGPSANHPLRYASRLLAVIFGDDSGSRLFWEFIDSGRAEYAGLSPNEYEDLGVYYALLCCAPEQAAENVERLDSLLDQLQQNGVTAAELELAKQKISAQLILHSERSESRMFSLGANWSSYRRYRTLEETLNSYQSVSLADIRQVLEAFPLEPSCMLVSGPLDRFPG